MPEEYCDLCDLPLSTCVHGMPPPPSEPPKAPKSSPVRTKRATPTTTSPPNRAPRRWTSPEELAPLIVGVLTERGGSADGDDVYAELTVQLEENFRPGDLERTPEGELRWQYAARRARQSLIKEGVMAAGEPGVWRLT